jgi:hypothetical protein
LSSNTLRKRRRPNFVVLEMVDFERIKY